MKSILKTLRKTWESKVKCTECLEEIEKGKVESHFQYCPRCRFFEETCFMLSPQSKPAAQALYSSLVRKMMIFKSNLKNQRLNLSSKEGSKNIEKMKTQEDKLKKRIIYYKILLRLFRFNSQDLKHFEFFLLFANENFEFSMKDSDFFAALFSSKRLIRNKFSTQLFFEREFSVRVDSKLRMNYCWYTEDGEFLAISDCERIYIYEIKTNRYLTKVSGNRSPKTALAGKFKYLIFQNKDFDIVVYNFKNGLEEYKITDFPKGPISYFKVSENNKFLICKFLRGEILIWNILSQMKIQYFSDKPDWNFVICLKNLEIFLFNSKIEVFDIYTGIKTRKILKNYSIIDYLAIINEEKLVFADNKKLQIFNYQTQTVIQNFPGYSDLYFLSKKFDFISSISGNALEIDSQVLTIANFCKGYIKENPLSMFPFSAPHIFCKKYNDNNMSDNDFILSQLIQDKNFISQELLIEKLVFNSGKLFVIYYNKKKLLIYIWDCFGNEKKLEIEDFSGKWTSKFISHDYLILEDKSFYNFYDFKTRCFDRYGQLGLKDCNKGNLSIEQFSILKNRKIAVFVCKTSNHFYVMKISNLNNIFQTNCYPVLDNMQKLIGTISEDEVRIYDIEKSKNHFRFGIRGKKDTFKGFYIINSRYVCLVFSKKLKIFDLFGNILVMKHKLKFILEKEELKLKILSNSFLYENGSKVTLITLNNSLEKFEFSTEELSEIKVSIKEDLGLLIIMGKLKPSNFNGDMSGGSTFSQYTCSLIDINSKTIIKNLTINLQDPPKLLKNFLIIFETSKLSIFSLSTLSTTSTFSVPDYKINEVIIEKSFICLQHSNKLSIFKISNSLTYLEIPKIQIISFSSSEDESLFGILNENQFVLYDSCSGNRLNEHNFKFLGYSKFIILRNKFVIITGQHMRIIILNIDQYLEKISRFKFKNEKVEDFRAVSDDDLMIHLIGRVNYIVFNPVKNKKIVKIRYKEMVTDSSGMFAILREMNGLVKIMNLATSETRQLTVKNEGLILGEFIERHRKFVVYDPMDGLVYLELAS